MFRRISSGEDQVNTIDTTSKVIRECPICGFQGPFEPGGPRLRPEAMCPDCQSLERQRLAWLYMLSETNLLDGRTPVRLLHVSPDRSLSTRLANEPLVAQLTADLNPAGVIAQMDISDIYYPEASFDAIYCSHVLEHVPEDRRAMKEMFRVLAPGGWALIQVPLMRDHTDEDPTVTDEAERTRRFGQRDHVRHYGRLDFPKRLAEAGFDVTVDPFPLRLGRGDVQRFGLTVDEKLILGRKPLNGRWGGSVHWLLGADDANQRQVVGRVEEITAGGVVTGWAWIPAAPNTRVTVRGILDGVDTGEVLADLERPSLAAAGVGDGRYCFRLQLPEARHQQRHHHVRVEAGENTPLTPSTGFTCSASSAKCWYVLDVV